MKIKLENISSKELENFKMDLIIPKKYNTKYIKLDKYKFNKLKKYSPLISTIPEILFNSTNIIPIYSKFLTIEIILYLKYLFNENIDLKYNLTDTIEDIADFFFDDHTINRLKLYKLSEEVKKDLEFTCCDDLIIHYVKLNEYEKLKILIKNHNPNLGIINYIVRNRNSFKEKGYYYTKYDEYEDNLLNIATRLGHTKIVELLLNEYKNNRYSIEQHINFQNKYNNTSLMIACINNRIDIVKILLEYIEKYKLDTCCLINKFGCNAIYIAISYDNWSIVKLLLKHSTREDLTDIIKNSSTLSLSISKGNNIIKDYLAAV